MDALWELTNARSNGNQPRPPTASHSIPQDWGFATLTQNCTQLNSLYARHRIFFGGIENVSIARYRSNFWLPLLTCMGTGKDTDFKFGRYNQKIHLNQRPLKILEKRERGHVQGLPNFWVPPIIPGTGKAADFKFCTHLQGQSELKPMKKFWEKQPWAQSESPENFQGTHMVRKLSTGSALFAEMLRTHSAFVRSFQCI